MVTPMRRRAFTLIELLIVIAIIMALAGLLIPGLAWVREAARANLTRNRMENINLALAAYGSSELTSAYQIHRLVLGRRLAAQGGTWGLRAGKPGVLDMITSNVTGVRVPDFNATLWFEGVAKTAAITADPWLYEDTGYQAYLNARAAATQTRPYPCMAWPWGKPALKHVDPQDIRLVATAPEALAIDSLDPGVSFELLLLADLFAVTGGGGDAETQKARTKYETDRRPGALWNDAWGNPLVAAWGLYQPMKNVTVERVVRITGQGTGTGTKLGKPQDYFWKAATDQYNNARTVYCAVAAAGPRVRTNQSGSGSAAFAAYLSGIWTQVAGKAADNGVFAKAGKVWTELSWSSPPWQGVGEAKWKGERCFLTQPQEIR